MFSYLIVVIHKVQYYDIRKKCEGPMCYNFTNVERLLNMQKVKSALGVSDDLGYALCSLDVRFAMMEDWMKNLEVGIPDLLEEGMKVLVYAGEEDLICNWLGELLFTYLGWKYMFELLMCCWIWQGIQGG